MLAEVLVRLLRIICDLVGKHHARARAITSALNSIQTVAKYKFYRQQQDSAVVIVVIPINDRQTTTYIIPMARAPTVLLTLFVLLMVRQIALVGKSLLTVASKFSGRTSKVVSRCLAAPPTSVFCAGLSVYFSSQCTFLSLTLIVGIRSYEFWSMV
jgi:hypothetical protein